MGAGPIGLLSAHAAARRGCKDILVLEQAQGFKPVGQDIDVPKNGMKALKLVAPSVFNSLLDKITTSAASRWASLSSDGGIDQMYDGEMMERMILNWYNFQTVLRKSLPDFVEIRTKACVVSLTDMHNEAIQVSYVQQKSRSNPYSPWYAEDNVERKPSTILQTVRGRIVIGADGIHSRCREWIYYSIGGPEWITQANPVYTGCTLVRWLFNRIPECARSISEKMDGLGVGFLSFESNVNSNESKLLHRCLLVRSSDNTRLTVVAIVNAAEEISRNSTKVHEQFLFAAKEELEYPPLINLIHAVCEEDVVPGVQVCYPQYVVPANEPMPFKLSSARKLPKNFWRPYARGRVFLVGDALHGCPPTLGQGVSMGCEDVCELIEMIAKSLKWEGAVDMEMLKSVESNYRHARLNRLSLVQRYSVNLLSFADRRAKEDLDKSLKDWTPVASGWESLLDKKLG